MDHLFELPTTKKLLLLSKEGLIDYIHSYSCSISYLRKQVLELQRENERLRNELGYGQTIAMQFSDEISASRANKKSAC